MKTPRALLHVMFGLAVCFWLVGCREYQEELADSRQSGAAANAGSEVRPVTKRVCSLAMIGNLGEMDVDTPQDVDTPAPATGSDSEPESAPEPGLDLSHLNDFDNPEQDAALSALIEERKSRLTPRERAEMERAARLRESESGLGTGLESDEVLEISATPSISMSDTVRDDADELSAILNEVLETPLDLEETPDTDATEGLEFADPKAAAEVELDTGLEPGNAEVAGDSEALEEIDLTRPMKVFADPKPSQETEEPQTQKKTTSEQLVEEVSAAPTLGFEDIQAEYRRQMDAFVALCKNVPPEVQAELHAANFQNCTIWVTQAETGDFYAVRTMEYCGEQYSADAVLLTRSPHYRAWTEEQARYLRPLAGFWSLDSWLNLGEVWHCD